jgi:16S rRNA processing protein RimM
MTKSNPAAGDLFPVGTVVGFRGLRGEVKIRPSTNAPELLLDIETVSVRMPGGKQVKATVTSVRLEKRMLIVTFAEYPDRTAAEFLEDAEVFVSRDQLRELEQEEWWVTDLVGLQAFTTSGAPIGKVTGVIDSGNQILEISSRAEGKSILVPFVKELVPVVDVAGGRVEIRDLPGLLEPQ